MLEGPNDLQLSTEGKGRVESGVGYVKKNFLRGTEFTDFSAVNPAAQLWLNEIANVREHGETHRRPVDLFAEERESLRRPNPNAYDLGRVLNVRASSQFRVCLDTNRYSVPAKYANQRVIVKAYPERVCIYAQDQLIARHVRCYDRHLDREDPHIRANYHELAQTAAEQGWGHLDYLQRLIEGEVGRREDKSLAQRIRRARFPVQKTLDQFQWSWPKKINRPQIQNLFRLNFIEQKANVIFLGTVGLGKTHLSIALGQAACARGYSVLFTSAIDIIHTLAAAAGTGSLKRTMQRYLKPSLIIMDEIGYLPIDKLGADLLFQVISERYERGAILMSTNRAFKTWPEIFNNDTTLTSALLDRLLHHADICQIEGPSYRAKDHIES